MAPLSLAPLLLASALFAAVPEAPPDEAPFVLSQAPLELRQRLEKVRTEFQFYGYRFDDAKGHVLSPKTKAPVPRAEVEKILAELEAQYRLMTLRRMHFILSRSDLDKPLPPEAQAELLRLAGARSESMPQSVLNAINAPKILGAEVLKAYEESTRFFDGKVPFKDRVGAALPVLGAWNAGERMPGYFDDSERRLGAALSRAAVERLKKNPIGKELIDRFRKNGALDLPQFLVLEVLEGAHAVYSPSNDAIILNFTAVVHSVLERAPPDRRDALRAKLKNAAALAEHLRQDPKALDDFVAGEDTTIVHEFVHAWQKRRDPSGVEQMRDNAPDFNALEGEQEAFIIEQRYLHQKILAGEPGALREAWDGEYRSFLADLDGYRQGIADLYLQNWPEQAAFLATGLELQNDRLPLARHLMGEGLWGQVSHALKMIGWARGTAALKADSRAYAGRFESFAKDQPRLQQEGFAKLAEWRAKEGRPDQAFELLTVAENAALAYDQVLGPDAVKKAEERAEKAAAASRTWLRDFETHATPLETRLAAADAIAARLVQRGQAPDKDLMELQARLRLSAAERVMKDYDGIADKQGGAARGVLARVQSHADVLDGLLTGVEDAQLRARAEALKKRLAEAGK